MRFREPKNPANSSSCYFEDPAIAGQERSEESRENALDIGMRFFAEFILSLANVLRMTGVFGFTGLY